MPKPNDAWNLLVRRWAICAAAWLALSLTACTGETNDPTGATSKPTAETKTLVLNTTTAANQVNDFAFRFFGQVSADETGNLFFSPLSIHAALSMTYAGARGETAEQMREVLAFRYAPDEGIEHHAYSKLLTALNSPPVTRVESIENGERKVVERPVFDLIAANRLWGQEGFAWNPGYIQLTEREYLAGLAEVDFRADAEGARNTINAWVENTTRDRIKDLIPARALDAMTRLVLTNAIYFKANWAETFDEQNTNTASFHLNGGEMIEVPMMHQSANFGYAETEDWQALEMPYEEGVLSMLVVLPADRDGAFSNVEQQLASGDLMDEVAALEQPKVKVWLPRFKMEQALELVEVLQSMGMTLAFLQGRADFRGMADAELYISKALHKAYVEVDEKGTEAAAATAVIIGLTSAPVESEQPKVFRAERPFVFLIRHNPSGAILFMGRVMDPR